MGGLREFGVELLRRRHAKGLSIADVARSTGLTTQTVAKYERHPPKRPERCRDTIISLARAVGMDVNEALVMTGFDPLPELPVVESDRRATLVGLLPALSDHHVDVLMIVARTLLGVPAVNTAEGYPEEGSRAETKTFVRLDLTRFQGVAAEIDAAQRAVR